MKAALVRSHKEAPDIFTFWLRPEGPVDYIAGQFVEINIPHHLPDDRGSKRWFTLSSSPTDAPLISITTKIAVKSSSFKRALVHLKAGDEVYVSSAMGDFVLPKQSERPVVFIAGGIGITPFHSIIKWLNKTKQVRDITFIYSVSNEKEIIFQKLFERYGMKRIIVVAQPTPDWTGLTGRLNGSRILELAQPKEDSLIYVAGPEPMTETLAKELINLSVDERRLVTDFFPGYPQI
ncbi:MAG TPA: FAD-dependent oxidoreductase [Patescibacteria group bacterium]|jgi:ferredoxin-NADP reductase|nr:FAD-dependent oxidoreductase [Patescibacteria group bacterium]